MRSRARTSRFTWALGGSALLVIASAPALVVLWQAPTSGFRTMHVSTSETAAAVGPVAGLALLAAGVAYVAFSSRAFVGLALAALGLTWSSIDLVGWPAGPAAIRSIALGAQLFVAPLLAYLLVAHAAGQVRRLHLLAGLSIAAAAVASAALVATYDPRRDPECWRYCAANPWAIFPDRSLAEGVVGAWWAAIALGALVAIGWLGLRFWRGELLRRTWPVLAAVAVALLVEAASGLSHLLRFAPADPAVDASLFIARGAALLAVALAAAWALADWLWQARSLGSLAADLDDLRLGRTSREALAERTGDPLLEVGYWEPAQQRFVRADGAPFEDRQPAGRSRTAIERSGELIALLVHHPSLTGAELERALGPAARLAIENEGLSARLLAQLAELRGAQRRVVEIMDSWRRTIERNLHDGPQQRLLALSFELRLAHAAAVGEAQSHLTSAVEQSTTALDELRHLAHGIYPASLSDGGLAVALDSIADRSRLALSIRSTATRCEPAIEFAAFVALREAIETIERGPATACDVAVDSDGGGLHVTLTADGPVQDGLPTAADRVGALGGRLSQTATGIEAWLPCPPLTAARG